MQRRRREPTMRCGRATWLPLSAGRGIRRTHGPWSRLRMLFLSSPRFIAQAQLHHRKLNGAFATRYDALAPTEWPHVAWSGSRPEEAGQRGGLLHPVRHLRLVELVAFEEVEVAHVLLLAGAGRDRSQR